MSRPFRHWEHFAGIGLVSIGLPLFSSLAVADDVATTTPIVPQAALMVAHPERGVVFDVKQAGDRLIAVGAHGVILQSRDGEHWQQVASPVDTALTWVSFADTQHGWAVGHDAAILYTADGGQHWLLQNFQPDLDAPIFSVTALDARTAVAVGAFGLLKRTADGGQHWSDADAPELTGDKYHLFAVTQLRDGRVFTVGEAGLMGVSADGGQSWSKLDAVYDGPLFGANPWHEHGAIAFGLLGNIYATENVGNASWTKIDAGTSTSMFGGMSLADDGVLLVGANGNIVRLAADGSVVKNLPYTAHENSGTWTAVALSSAGIVLAGEPGLVQEKK